jgi:16S rRNA (uracil1498-N3)-methyltransferase
VSVVVADQIREQRASFPVALLFSPLKKESMVFMLEKATELGVTLLQPVWTQRTQGRTFSSNKLQSHLISAAEQSDRLCIPDLKDPLEMMKAVGLAISFKQQVWVCCEPSFRANHEESARVESVTDCRYAISNIFDLLQELSEGSLQQPRGCILLVGPEGGFSPQEFAWLSEQNYVRFVSLGHNTLRAETAGISALALVHARFR